VLCWGYSAVYINKRCDLFYIHLFKINYWDYIVLFKYSKKTSNIKNRNKIWYRPYLDQVHKWTLPTFLSTGPYRTYITVGSVSIGWSAPANDVEEEFGGSSCSCVSMRNSCVIPHIDAVHIHIPNAVIALLMWMSEPQHPSPPDVPGPSGTNSCPKWAECT
jgi:hypothetical protein